MDGYEVKEQYYALVADVRPERRREAAGLLGGSTDANVKKLAAAGQDVANVIHEGADPKTLEQAIKTLGTLPISDYWNGFAETTGQTLLLKADSERGARQSSLREYGLKIARMAQNAGFPLTDATIELVKNAKEDRKLRDLADDIIRRNASYRPQKERLHIEKPPEKAKGKAKKRHT